MPNIEPDASQVIALIAVFNNNKELLLLKRPDDVHCGGLWSFPGGKVENNEMPLQAGIRELKEETSLSGKLWRHLGKASHHYDDRALHFLFFTCICPNISNLNVESPYAWIKLDELHHYPMPEANAKLIPMLSMPEMGEYLNSC